MSYTSKYSPTSQQSTIDAELAQLASEGFARLLADSGHAHLDATHTAAGGGGGADATGEVSEAVRVPSPAYIKACTELVRIAIALHMGLLIRLWLVMSELARQTNRNGFTRKEIKDGLRDYNVKFSGRNLSRWLNAGLEYGYFWNYDAKTKLYYPRGYESLCQSIIDSCNRAGREALYITNYPGQRRPMLINVASDNLLQFEANGYAGWVASRETLIISRQTLFTLTGRTLPAIRQWEVTANVDVMENFTYCDEQYHDAIPRNEDGTWRRDVHRTTLNGRDVIGWQMPNAYSAPITQHPKKGKLRTVYSRLKSFVTSQAASVCGQGESIPGGSNRYMRRYHPSNKSARNSYALNGLRPRYVFKGRHGSKYGYFEYTPDGREQFEYWQLRRVFRRLQCVCSTKRVKKIVGFEDTYIEPF